MEIININNKNWIYLVSIEFSKSRLEETFTKHGNQGLKMFDE